MGCHILEDIIMEHKWLRLFDSHGNWTGSPDRTVKLDDGSVHSIDDLAKKHGIDLPESKKHINTGKKNADLEQSHDSGHTEIDGDGDSEVSE